MARDERKHMGFGDTLGERPNNNVLKEENTDDTEIYESKQEENKSVEEESNKESKSDIEYKGELASVLNREETEKKYKGWNIKISSIKRLRELCKDQPKGAETNLINLIIENALDNIESKGKL